MELAPSVGLQVAHKTLLKHIFKYMFFLINTVRFNLSKWCRVWVLKNSSWAVRYQLLMLRVWIAESQGKYFLFIICRKIILSASPSNGVFAPTPGPACYAFTMSCLARERSDCIQQTQGEEYFFSLSLSTGSCLGASLCSFSLWVGCFATPVCPCVHLKEELCCFFNTGSGWVCLLWRKKKSSAPMAVFPTLCKTKPTHA